MEGHADWHGGGAINLIIVAFARALRSGDAQPLRLPSRSGASSAGFRVLRAAASALHREPELVLRVNESRGMSNMQMKPFAVVGVCLAVVLAFSAMVASSAMAVPEYRACVKTSANPTTKRYEGKYSVATCATEASGTEQAEGKKNRYERKAFNARQVARTCLQGQEPRQPEKQPGRPDLPPGTVQQHRTQMQPRNQSDRERTGCHRRRDRMREGSCRRQVDLADELAVDNHLRELQSIRNAV